MQTSAWCIMARSVNMSLGTPGGRGRKRPCMLQSMDYQTFNLTNTTKCVF